MANHLAYDALSRIVERQASSDEQAGIERHLAGCGRCRSELAWLQRIRGAQAPRRALLQDDGGTSPMAISPDWLVRGRA